VTVAPDAFGTASGRFCVNPSIRHGFGTALARVNISLEAFPREVSAQCLPSIVSSPFPARVGGRLPRAATRRAPHPAPRRHTPDLPPASGDDLARIALDLLGRFDFAPDRLYRLAGIGVSNFQDEPDLQPALWNDER